MKTIEDADAVAQEIASVAGAVTGSYAGGQVLGYAGQLARGIFVVLEGAIALTEEGGDDAASVTTVFRAGSGGKGLSVPCVDHIDQPLPATVTTVGHARILFVSRTAIVTKAPVASILRSVATGAPTHSLHTALGAQ